MQYGQAGGGKRERAGGGGTGGGQRASRGESDRQRESVPDERRSCSNGGVARGGRDAEKVWEEKKSLWAN